MLFNSYSFLLFLAVTLAIYYARPLRGLQLEVLLAASAFFYAWGQPWLLLLLMASATVTSIASYAVLFGSRPRLAAVLGVAANLSVLVFFKYNRLVAESLGADLHKVGSLGEALLLLPLPVGISFYTFQGISLVVDCFKSGQLHPDQASPIRHYRDTLFYIMFFPHLVAGPIVKAHDFLPQIGAKRFADIDWESATHNIVLGYFLKVVIADNLAQQTSYIACPACLNLASLDLVMLLVGYSAQIFADFCGYSTIAIGVAALFGYRLPENFNRPYIAGSIADFWRRWHISLSSFLREYLYVPLGGSRTGPWRTYFNLVFVMVVGGLWHGADWSFAVWGLWHGLGLAIERPFLGSRFYTDRSVMMQIVRGVLVFGFVTLGWLLFKITSMADVMQYLGAIWGNTGYRPSGLRNLVIGLYVLPVVVYHLLPFAGMRWREYRKTIEGGLAAAIVLNSGSSHAFIYFQF